MFRKYFYSGAGRAAALSLLASISLAGCSEKEQPALPAAEAAASDFLVVVNRPNNLQLVDLKQRKVVNTCELPGDFGPGTVAMSPDHRTAYVLTNRFENLYGVDIDSCEIRFSARQSQGDERVKSIGSIAVSPDGSEVYTHQNPTRLLIDRYEVQDARIAVIVSRDTTYDLARHFETLARANRMNVIVFNDLETARTWLGV
jgi:hypothetical protein